jgi:hypothetical protein
MTDTNDQPYSAVLDEMETTLSKMEQDLNKKIENVSSLRSSVLSSVEKIDNLISVLEEDAQ